ncbi:hypothetical protein EV426DRAFT_710950 [Tirmania nivea]|nr:hypothetical protein EV426DRAFT_710950 [Tirmania nivea]
MTTHPTPSHHTLLFKSHRTTVLLSALPSTPLTDLTHLLFTALTGSSPHHITSPLPATPQALVLGLPRNPSDWSRGWYPIGEGSGAGVEGAAADAEDGPGDAGARMRTTAKGRKAQEWTVEKAGLKDGSVVAYYVRTEGGEEGFRVDVPVEEGDDDDEDEDEGEGEEEEDWKGPHRGWRGEGYQVEEGG